MPAGRPQKPLEQKRLTGRTPDTDSGGRPIGKTLTLVEKTTTVPEQPEGLRARGQVEWAKIWESGSAWLHPDQDYPWIEQIARAWDDIETFRAVVEHDGLVQTGSQGQPVAHPLIAEIRRCEDTIRKCLSVIGFSPSDRARLGLAELQRQSKLQEMMAKSQGR